MKQIKEIFRDFQSFGGIEYSIQCLLSRFDNFCAYNRAGRKVKYIPLHLLRTAMSPWHAGYGALESSSLLPCVHAQGVKQSVCPSVAVVGTKIARSQGVYACEQIVSTIKLSNASKNWFDFASNQ